jgi:hypothetical protein
VISPKLRNWIAVTVTVVWACNFLAALIPQLNYKTDPTLHIVFMGIVGGAFALGRGEKDQQELEKKRADEDNEEGKSS